MLILLVLSNKNCTNKQKNEEEETYGGENLTIKIFKIWFLYLSAKSNHIHSLVEHMFVVYLNEQQHWRNFQTLVYKIPQCTYNKNNDINHFRNVRLNLQRSRVTMETFPRQSTNSEVDRLSSIKVLNNQDKLMLQLTVNWQFMVPKTIDAQ